MLTLLLNAWWLWAPSRKLSMDQTQAWNLYNSPFSQCFLVSLKCKHHPWGGDSGSLGKIGCAFPLFNPDSFIGNGLVWAPRLLLGVTSMNPYVITHWDIVVPCHPEPHIGRVSNCSLKMLLSLLLGDMGFESPISGHALWVSYQRTCALSLLSADMHFECPINRHGL